MAKILLVELDTANLMEVDATELCSNYVGGVGLNTRLLWDHVPPGSDPLGPDNILVFSPGALVGTLLPTACRTEVSAKSPLSGRFGTANAGGEWGSHLIRAGYRGVVIRGRSSHPVVLVIDQAGPRLEPAADLWGLDTWQTVHSLKKRLGNDYQVASIGPAGEQKVAFASIQNNYFASWGRTGMGAVMGSKGLKAIAVRGWMGVEVATPRLFNKVMREGFARVKGDPTFGPISRYGSMLVSDVFNSLNGLPGHNFQVGSFADWEQTRGRKIFEKKYKHHDVACLACPIACCHWSLVREGPLAGYQAKGLEVTFVLEFGAKLGVKDIASILQGVELCNRLGMDVISACGVLSFAMEACQLGLLDDKTVPEWGDGEGICRALHLIGYRKGIGDLLAQGTKEASRQLAGSVDLAIHVKGVELPHRDPRAKWDVWTLGYLTNTRGGDSLRTRSPAEWLLGKVVDYMHETLEGGAGFIDSLDMPASLKGEIFGESFSSVNIPKMAAYAEDLITIINSVGMCIRPPVLRSLGPDWYTRALAAVTGQQWTETALLAFARQTWDSQHAFNVREGETAAEYIFPARIYQRPLPGFHGEKSPLDAVAVDKVVKEYFLVRGWYAENDERTNNGSNTINSISAQVDKDSEVG